MWEDRQAGSAPTEADRRTRHETPTLRLPFASNPQTTAAMHPRKRAANTTSATRHDTSPHGHDTNPDGPPRHGPNRHRASGATARSTRDATNVRAHAPRAAVTDSDIRYRPHWRDTSQHRLRTTLGGDELTERLQQATTIATLVATGHKPQRCCTCSPSSGD